MSRPADEATTARARGKFVPDEGDRPAADDGPKPWWARGPPSALDLERIVTLSQAAELSGISEDGWRRHHKHLIRRLSPRRVGVKLRDALAIGQPKDAT